MSLFKRLFRRPKIESADHGDQHVLEQLRQLGADLSQPRHVIHYLYLPNREAAVDAAERLQSEGFAVNVDRAADRSTRWAVLAEHVG